MLVILIVLNQLMEIAEKLNVLHNFFPNNHLQAYVCSEFCFQRLLFASLYECICCHSDSFSGMCFSCGLLSTHASYHPIPSALWVIGHLSTARRGVGLAMSLMGSLVQSASLTKGSSQLTSAHCSGQDTGVLVNYSLDWL